MNKTIILFLVVSLIFIGCQGGRTPVSKADSEKEVVWYQQPLRIAALQCNFGEDNLAVIDKWVDMGFNTEQLFHLIADNYSAIYKPDDHRTLLQEYVKKAHAKGVRVILYLNIHILGPSFDHKKEEWSQRKKDGSISYLYNTYPSVCLNSPWKNYFFTVLDSLKKIDIDGIFLDGPVIANGGCYCKHCRAEYRKLFGGEIGTDLDKMWEFNAYTRDHFLQSAYDYWKKDNPDKLFYMNLPVTHTKSMYVKIENALKYNDILGTEGGFQFYQPAKKAFLWRPSLAAKLLEALAPEKPRVIFMAADHKPWSWWMHSLLETKLCISSITANAANIWYGLHGSTKLLNTESAQAARETLSFIKEQESLLANTRSLAQVALLYSFSNGSKDVIDFVTPTGKKISRGDAEKALRGYYSLLTETHIPFDIVTDYKLNIKTLDRYKVLVLPNVFGLDKSAEDAIRKFVKRGGVLIAELGASLYDEKGHQKKTFGLSDVFGVSTDGRYRQHANYNYFVLDSMSSYHQHITSPLLPLPLLTLDIQPVAEANVIGTALKDLPGRYVPLTQPDKALIVEHSFGNGKAVYFAGSFGEMYNEYHVQEYKALIKNILLDRLGRTILFENAPVNMEVVLREQGNRKILHLVNYQAGPTRPFETATRVPDLIVKIPQSWNITKVKSQKLNKTLKAKTNEGYIKFTLPELSEYDILVME